MPTNFKTEITTRIFKFGKKIFEVLVAAIMAGPTLLLHNFEKNTGNLNRGYRLSVSYADCLAALSLA